jgi:hypothetical protein
MWVRRAEPENQGHDCTKCRSARGTYFAISVNRVSRIIVTRISPG